MNKILENNFKFLVFSIVIFFSLLFFKKFFFKKNKTFMNVFNRISKNSFEKEIDLIQILSTKYIDFKKKIIALKVKDTILILLITAEKSQLIAKIKEKKEKKIIKKSSILNSEEIIMPEFSPIEKIKSKIFNLKDL